MAEYLKGQVWEYKTREDEESSLVYIVKIDEDENMGKIYHIFIDGIKLKNPHIESGVQTVLPHAPVDEKTLTTSLTKLKYTTQDLPDISNGYSTWKSAYDSNEGGVFNIPIRKIIQYIEDIVNEN
jgi:hypothetical protein